jgi:hypothetical protein
MRRFHHRHMKSVLATQLALQQGEAQIIFEM